MGRTRGGGGEGHLLGNLTYVSLKEQEISWDYSIDYIVFSCNHREVKNSIDSAQTGFGLAWRRPLNERPVEMKAGKDLAYRHLWYELATWCCIMMDFTTSTSQNGD
jgi:hypothetical protein